MVEAVMSLEGATCISLGAQMPLAEIASAVQAYQADIVGLSFSAAFPLKKIGPARVGGSAQGFARLSPAVTGQGRITGRARPDASQALLARIMSAAFSAIMKVGALVWAAVTG